MAKPGHIELPTGERIPILYEDRSVLAIDKPPGWMLVPFSWQKTNRNLQAALVSSIASGAYWARARGLKYLRFVHRLDAETSGVLLLAKSPGAVHSLGALFEGRRVAKVYLAVVSGVPGSEAWTCRQKLAPDPGVIGRMRAVPRDGKEAETHFRVLQCRGQRALIEARPVTGRTHQIRVHLAASGHPVEGDPLYGTPRAKSEKPSRRPARRDAGAGAAAPAGGEADGVRAPADGARGPGTGMGLRAVRLGYTDLFTRRRVDIQAPWEPFVSEYGFDVFQF